MGCTPKAPREGWESKEGVGAAGRMGIKRRSRCCGKDGNQKKESVDQWQADPMLELWEERTLEQKLLETMFRWSLYTAISAGPSSRRPQAIRVSSSC